MNDQYMISRTLDLFANAPAEGPLSAVPMGSWERADVGPTQQVVQAGDGGQHVLLLSSRGLF